MANRSRSQPQGEVLPRELAARTRYALGVFSQVESCEELAQSLADPGWLGRRGTHDSIDPNRSFFGEGFDTAQSLGEWDFDEALPIAQSLKQRHFNRAKMLVPASPAGIAAHELDTSGVLGGSSWYGDRVDARDLCSESKRERGTQRGRAYAGLVDDFLDQTLSWRWSHPQSRLCASPIEPSTDTTQLACARQAGEGLCYRLRRTIEILWTPESVARSKNLPANISSDGTRTQDRQHSS